MILSRDVKEEMDLIIPCCPPECGGILGMHDDIIMYVEFDIKQTNSTHMCSYYPDVNFFNNIIRKWASEGIAFKGMFHTHFANVKTLSDGDIEYIEKIMNAVKESADHLYFPVYILPDRDLIVYLASLKNGRVNICVDDLIIV